MSFTVTVLGVHDQMVALAWQLNAATNVPKARKSSLLAKLDHADRYYRAGAKTMASSQLGSFINQVGQLARPLTRQAKMRWIGAAARIIAVLG